ncbi:hypothetical protein PC128_g25357 [Phytophthora cactorum]|nr:hypothetical protein GQ600_8482 [Phytophthora cactorum]KAG2987979.1 hypothetical protein PC120_g23498 [Phytophthora cactorum]KAG3043448.1 hypothetical protein PC121_g22538 [Phytophthora cactorum]KAG3139534.1 hypothetical protein PC128_g25357 [Phytophthora cactorum]KAG4039365.1 hypothetical protein PC123_g25085 [Phytophthora cactorum]
MTGSAPKSAKGTPTVASAASAAVVTACDLDMVSTGGSFSHELSDTSTTVDRTITMATPVPATEREQVVAGERVVSSLQSSAVLLDAIDAVLGPATDFKFGCG